MKIRLCRLLLCLPTAWGLTTSPVWAQSGQRLSIEGRILSVTENRVEIDRGSLDGVEPGDTVRFKPRSGAEVSAQVERVEEHSCWVQLSTMGTIEPGVACEITLSNGLGQPRVNSGLGNGLPSQAPSWQRRVQEWDQQRPLLADDPLQPEERDPIWSGRFYTSFNTSLENESEQSTSIYSRTGVDLRGENPFGYGGRVRMSVDLDYRSYSSDSSSSESDMNGRLERLSYAHGGDRFHALRWEAGRFLSSLYPEFGVIDGVEMQYRLASGMTVGGSFGYMPEPGADYATGKDLQVAAYLQAIQGENNGLRWGGGVQKTWHQGTADRDLMLLKLDYLPNSNLRIHSSAWIDVYGAEDVGKGKGAELTTANVMASWREKEYGASVGYRQWRYPELLRYQAGSFTNTELLKANTSRADLRLWRNWTEQLRLSGRVDSWQSEDASGGSAEIRLDWSDLIGPDLDTSFMLYSRQGSYTDATGFRLDQYIGLEEGSLRVSWESVNYTPSEGGDSELMEHDVHLSWDHWNRNGWSFNIDGGLRFGDQVNSPYAALYLQRRF
jgi:hypothetical protein